MKSNNINTNQQAGLSLVEILVTVLIFAVGSLGIASLQLTGLKYSQGAYSRTQITILSDDMANRIKSNRTFALNQKSDGSYNTGSPYEIDTFTGQMTVAKNCILDECDDQELADYDIASWVNEVSRTIPSGRGRVQVIDTVDTNGLDDRQFSIEFQWRQVANSTDPDGTDADDVKTIAYRVSL